VPPMATESTGSGQAPPQSEVVRPPAATGESEEMLKKALELRFNKAQMQAISGLRGDNYSRINTPEIFTVLMQTMDRQTIIMQRVHHVLVVAFHLLM